MDTPNQVHLEPGRVYRTEELERSKKNASRLAKLLVEKGALVPLARGLFVHPKRSRFGVVPPSDTEVMRAFLKGAPFVFSGPDLWNALGLGSTAVYAATLVYNTKRSGNVEIGGRRFILRRLTRFPENPTPEWFIVDLFANADRAGVSTSVLTDALGRALKRGEFDRARLQEVSEKYGSKRAQALIASALKAAPA